jgi:hypothetical protein
MGERADNLKNAWNSGFLDWDAVLGTGFGLAPAEWVSVWRECSPEELIKAARLGLAIPPPEMRPPEVRQEMELLDSFRPPTIIQQGISRLNSIYASPSPHDVPQLPHRRERMVVEMMVDPGEAFVGDMDFITCLIPFISANKHGLERFCGAFRKYWETIIPLGDFLQRYERVEMADGGHWVVRQAKAGDDSLPKTFFAPEILVRTPVISPRHIRLMR